MRYQDGLVFYDLEWTGPELLQIGAVCSNESFDRTILTRSDIHPKVSAQIMLQTRIGPDMTRMVYDCKRELFLPSCNSNVALKEFLIWLKSMETKFGQVILISHGSLDIPILYQSFAEHDMEEEFLKTISHFLDFQEYLRSEFPGLPLGLPALVQLVCGDQEYRLHCARDDASATQQVFFKLHQVKTDWGGNTQLVIPDEDKFGSQFAPFKRIKLNFMNYEKGSKEMRFFSHNINPESVPQMVETMDDWFSILSTLPLFRKVDPPRCHMFSVDGWVIRHHLVEDGGQSRTRIDLFCSLSNSFFKMVFYPDFKATFMKKKLLLSLPLAVAVPKGTPVVARLKMKEGQGIRVMYIKEVVHGSSTTLQDALSKLNEVSDMEWVTNM